MEEVLLYNLDNEKGNRIKQLCALMKIRFKSVSRVDYLEPIGAIAGIKGVERKNIPFEGQAFTDEMIVFKNFSDKVLEDFLRRYRQSGIEKVALKAGLTPYNIVWNSFKISDELMRENEEMSKLEK